MRNGKQKNKINYFWQSQKVFKNLDSSKSQGKKTVVIEKKTEDIGKTGFHKTFLQDLFTYLNKGSI